MDLYPSLKLIHCLSFALSSPTPPYTKQSVNTKQNTKVLKTSMVKEPENKLITGFMVGRGPTNSWTGDVINNLIIIYLNYINN